MNLPDYVRMLRKHARFVVVVFVIAILASTSYAYSQPKSFQSKIRLFVSTAQASNSQYSSVEGDAYSGQLLSAERVKSYAALIQGPRVASDIHDRVPCALLPSIQASAPLDTVLIDVYAVSPTPACAQETANAAGDVIVKLVDELERSPGAARAPLRVTVVERAALPAAPIAPQKKIIVAMGAFFGLAAAIAFCVIREKLDTSIKHPDQLGRVTHSPVVGVIGYDARSPRRPLVVQSDPRSPGAEAFRQLRTNIRFVNVDRTVRSLVVTSALSTEGKSTVSCNLAIAMAQAGQRVILVEADLRKPMVRQYMGVEGAVGLTNVLLGEIDLDDALQPWGGGLLHVLPGGALAPNPSELLGSLGMAEVVARLEAMSDLVIFDAPPLLPVTDAAVLGVNTDGAVIVVRSGKTTRDRVERAVESLAGVGVRIVGSVLTMAPTKGPDSYHYYAYYGKEMPSAGLRGWLERKRNLRRQPKSAQRAERRPTGRRDMSEPADALDVSRPS